MYYDKNGRPLETLEFARLFEDKDYRRVALDDIGLISVSTVWLGLDHNHAPVGPPLIFESAIIDHSTPEPMEIGGKTLHADKIEICERYSTLEEALKGHESICDRVRSAVAN